ncbi:MAG TPA: hypothetical protein VMM35_08160 [Longimicrobiales bacterium]|nr:hypothetical protein [Longimicrobiales bacterium]
MLHRVARPRSPFVSPFVAFALLVVIAAAAPTVVAGQWRASPTRPAEPQTTLSPSPSPIEPTLLSLALPGAGQHVLRQDRKWLYLALEVAGWALWVERRAAAFDYRDRYRDYAWEGARIQAGARVEADFEYYERLTQWTRSGAFDADPASPGVQPEVDPLTYNGSVWSLASQIHLPPGPLPPETDPAYQSALAYYQDRAYGTALLWDWTAGSGSQQELARLIEESDSRFGHATTVLGAVIANHLLSAVDAYISAQGRSSPARIRVVPDESPGAVAGWLVVLSVEAGW